MKEVIANEVVEAPSIVVEQREPSQMRTSLSEPAPKEETYSDEYSVPEAEPELEEAEPTLSDIMKVQTAEL